MASKTPSYKGVDPSLWAGPFLLDVIYELGSGGKFGGTLLKSLLGATSECSVR